MFPIVARLSSQLKASGDYNHLQHAIDILKKQGILNSDGELTKKGRERQALGNEGRAKERQARYSNGKHTEDDYNYNPITNKVTLKKYGR